MTVKDRIQALVRLGLRIKDEEWLASVIPAACAINNWFREDTIRQSLKAISEEFLAEDKLIEWLAKYDLVGLTPKKIALILAGNIPAVGFHDVLCVLVSGHIASIKLSSKDSVLIKQMLVELVAIEPEFSSKIEYISRIDNIDGIIATGSNNTSLYFEHYFSKYPHIIRKNRKSVGVIYPSTTDEELRAIGKDILSYYGLGCRNVSKVYIHEDVDKAHIMEIWHEFKEVILHNKYKNNYDYNYTVYLLNQEDFLMNGALLLRPDPSLHSRIASVHYETFKEKTEVQQSLKELEEELQCIVSAETLDELPTVAPGMAQQPGLADYADHVDTIEFLKNI